MSVLKQDIPEYDAGNISAEDLVNDYLKWLRGNIYIHQYSHTIFSIETPFLDRNNDHFQVFVVVEKDRLKITDDRNTISDLESSGFDFNTETRNNIKDQMLRSFGVSCSEDNELFVYASSIDFPQKKHALLQAMISIDDLYTLSRSHVATLFKQDVKKYLNDHDIRYSEDIILKGKSGLQHTFDFLITASDIYPERLIKVSQKIEMSSASIILFAWTEICEIRQSKPNLYVFSNSEQSLIQQKYRDAFINRDVKLVSWEKRDEFAAELAG